MSIISTDTTNPAGQYAASSRAHGSGNSRPSPENGSHDLRNVASPDGIMLLEVYPSDAPPAYTAIVTHKASSPATSVAQSPPAYHKQPSPLCFICDPGNQAAIEAGSVCSRFISDVKAASTGDVSDAVKSGSKQDTPRTTCSDSCPPWSHIMTAMSLNWKVSKFIGRGKTYMQSSQKIYSRKAVLSSSELQKAAALLAQVGLKADDAEALLQDERYLHTSGMDRICAGAVKRMLDKRERMLEELHRRAKEVVAGRPEAQSSSEKN